MNKAELEQITLHEMQSLSIDNVQAVLDYVLILKNRPLSKRPLGLLKNKVRFEMNENFSISDDELFNS